MAIARTSRPCHKHVASHGINVPEETQIYCLYQVRYEAPVTQLNRDYNTNKFQMKDFAFRTFKLKYTMLSNEDIETKYTMKTPPQALKFT